MSSGISGTHNPCLPVPYFSPSFIITFNPNIIKEMIDWYPTICTKNNITNRTYTNEGFFVTLKNMTLNNLVFNDYTFDYNYNPGLIAYNAGGDYMRFTDCIFKNIHTVCVHDKDALIYTVSNSLEFVNTTFQNISSSSLEGGICKNSYFILEQNQII